MTSHPNSDVLCYFFIWTNINNYKSRMLFKPLFNAQYRRARMNFRFVFFSQRSVRAFLPVSFALPSFLVLDLFQCRKSQELFSRGNTEL